jgi:hypothetical protein
VVREFIDDDPGYLRRLAANPFLEDQGEPGRSEAVPHLPRREPVPVEVEPLTAPAALFAVWCSETARKLSGSWFVIYCGLNSGHALGRNWQTKFPPRSPLAWLRSAYPVPVGPDAARMRVSGA